jgi:hypothetical protein
VGAEAQAAFFPDEFPARPQSPGLAWVEVDNRLLVPAAFRRTNYQTLLS